MKYVNDSRPCVQYLNVTRSPNSKEGPSLKSEGGLSRGRAILGLEEKQSLQRGHGAEPARGEQGDLGTGRVTNNPTLSSASYLSASHSLFEMCLG